MSNIYESEFEENLIDLFKKNYSISKDVYRYIVLRYMLVFDVPKFKDIDIEEFSLFLLTENNLNYPLVYKGIEIDKSTMNNIAQNIIFEIVKESSMDFIIGFIENTYEKIRKDSMCFNSKFRNTLTYSNKVMYGSLYLLNKMFNISFSSFEKMEGFEYPNDYNEFERFREEKLESFIDFYKLKEPQTALITEKDLENYLKGHLYKIEEGLEFISSQEAIKDGVIDILAKDKNQTYVLIELKIVPDDSRVVWQSLYYPKEFKIEKTLDNVRMIVVSPKLNESILTVLKDFENIEYFEYDITVSKEKIIDFRGKKIL